MSSISPACYLFLAADLEAQTITGGPHCWAQDIEIRICSSNRDQRGNTLTLMLTQTGTHTYQVYLPVKSEAPPSTGKLGEHRCPLLENHPCRQYSEIAHTFWDWSALRPVLIFSRLAGSTFLDVVARQEQRHIGRS